MRSELIEFAEAMEAKLEKNDYKSSWENESTEYLIDRLEEEITELLWARHFGGRGGIANEAVDVANFAMMIYNKAKQGSKT